MKRIKHLLLPILVAFLLSGVAIVKKDGFSLSLIQNPTRVEEPFEQGDLTLAQSILSQPFTYLGKGRQTFVFESADGTAVLKLFNQSYFKNPWYLDWIERGASWIPFSQIRMSINTWLEKERTKRGQRKEFYCRSYRIAFEELQEESGLLYIHFGSGTDMSRVRIKDSGSIAHEIDLNRLPFILQKKGIPFSQALDQVFAELGLPGLEKMLDEFVEDVAFRIALGISDADQDVMHNWGVAENRVFHLDPGRLYWNEELLQPDAVRLEWLKSTQSLKRWLKKQVPEAAIYLEANIDRTRREQIAQLSPISPALRKGG